MNILLDTNSELARFARTQIGFATWCPGHAFVDLAVVLFGDAPGSVHCAMRATSEALGTVASGAVAEDRFEAVARAARLLEAAVDDAIVRRGADRSRQASPATTAWPGGVPTSDRALAAMMG